MIAALGSLPLRTRLAAGAAVLTIGTVLTALTLFFGMTRVADRLETALAAEARMARYSILSTQVSTFLVVATEAVQTGLPSETRADRIAPVIDNIHQTFAELARDLERAVAAAEALGLDQQSRHGTQSLGLARMQALLDSTVRGLVQPDRDPDTLRAHLNTFASTFDPLLNQAVNTEVLLRRDTLASIESLRASLSLLAVGMGLLAVFMVIGFYFGLIRPQFDRLDRLRTAARQIGREDFAVALPDTQADEIGMLYAETNRMAEALAQRQEAVRAEWARLNETIDQRTEELRAANARLEQIDETRRRFFADVSHELRTPLTVILMEAQIGRQADSAGRDAFATIETRAARLNRRIDDLLRVARSDSGELALDRQTVAVPDLLDEVADEVRAECDNAGMALTLPRAPDVTVDGDPNWLRQVLVGLVRNAIRYARSGEALSIGARVTGDTVEIAITDNGPGIDPDQQARIFDRFSQGDKPNGAGFGIGLALAKWVVEAQDGTIACTSPLPRSQALGEAPGTKVSVRLPVQKG